MSAEKASPSGPVIIDIAGPQLTDEDRQLLCEPGVAGIILFGRNVVDAAQVQELCQQLRALRPDLLICIDQEGGRVQRLQQGVTRIPPMAVIGDLYQQDQARALSCSKEVGWVMARELRALGIDLSFAPVLDLDRDFCAAIGDRSFGCDPLAVVAIASAFIDGMHAAGMGAVGKHFPGHGKVQADSHRELPIDKRALEDIQGHDLVPFAALCKNQLQGVMPAHIVFEAVDANPVGFSSVWLNKILRGQLGYEGLIFSDDLNMAAASAGGSYAARAQTALAAGCDLLLICNNRPAAKEVLAAVGNKLLSPTANQRKLKLINANPTEMNGIEQQRLAKAAEMLALLKS